jgi:hypothetical protein
LKKYKANKKSEPTVTSPLSINKYTKIILEEESLKPIKGNTLLINKIPANLVTRSHVITSISLTDLFKSIYPTILFLIKREAMIRTFVNLQPELRMPQLYVKFLLIRIDKNSSNEVAQFRQLREKA